MNDFLKFFDTLFCKFWNGLYEYLCEAMDVEVNPDYYIESLFD